MNELMKFKIDAEFENYLPALPREKFEQLEKLIVSEGCREPLVIWAGEDILLDGHNRYKICRRHNIPFQVIKKEFNSEDDAKLWMIMTQASRRNWTEEEETLMMGKAFELQKKQGARTDLTSVQNEPKLTAAKVGKEFGKSASTVKRAAAVTAAVENLTKKIDPNFKKNYVEGNHPANVAIVAAAKVADAAPEKAKEILEGKSDKPEQKKEVKKQHEPALAMQYATMAISQLERIRPKDPDKQKALDKVIEWIEENR